MVYQNFLVTMALIISFCAVCDWVAKPEEVEKNKEILEKWYHQLWNFTFKEALKSINEHFLKTFDSIYGSRHLSLKCFAMSIMTTIASIFVISFLTDAYTSNDQNKIFFVILFCFLLNIFIDYLSLLETRWILDISFSKTHHFLIMFLFLDVLLTITIFLFGSYLVIFVTNMYSAGWELNSFWYVVDMSFERLYFISIGKEGWENFQPIFEIAFYSTFATSMIYYLYLFNFFGLKLLSASKERLMPIILKIQESNNTYKTIGAFLAAFIGLIKASTSFIGSFT